MKRVLKKAIAFVSAIAVAASMAVSASAASATQVVKNGKYKQVIASTTGVYFTNFSEKEIRSGSSGKTVLCVTPDGKKKKVNVDNSSKLYGSNMVLSSSVYMSWGDSIMHLYYNNAGAVNDEFIFTNGKKLDVKESDDYNSTSVVGNCVVLSNRDNCATYLQSSFVVYNSKGKKIDTIKYSSLKSAPDYVSMTDYDIESKTALFQGYIYNEKTNEMASCFWMVQNNKTIKKFTGANAFFTKNGKGATVLATSSDYSSKLQCYSLKTGKKVAFSVQDDSDKSTFSIEMFGSDYVVYDKSGNKIYTIAQSKVKDYKLYENSVAIITKSGSKYGLVMVK